MSQQHPEFQFFRVIYHQEADIDSDLDKGIADTGEGEPEAEPEGTEGEGEETGEDADHEQSNYDYVVVADLLFLEVFIEEDPHHHCEGPAAEEEGVLGLHDLRFGS